VLHRPLQVLPPLPEIAALQAVLLLVVLLPSVPLSPV
jgi:hypothetical protein